MMSRKLVILAFACVGLLQPRASEAGLADFIWGLSGPQMFGVGYGCRWGFSGEQDVCEIGAPGNLRDNDPRFFHTLAASVYFSTGLNVPYGGSATVDYGAFRVWMLALEQSVSVRGSVGKMRSYHGVGLTFTPGVSFHEGVHGFSNAGVKITPLELVVSNRLALSGVVRYFPHRFVPSDFNYDHPSASRDGEWTVGVGANIICRRFFCL